MAPLPRSRRPDDERARRYFNAYKTELMYSGYNMHVLKSDWFVALPFFSGEPENSGVVSA